MPTLTPFDVEGLETKYVRGGAQWFIRGVDAEINLFWISGQHYHKKALCCVFHKNNYNHIFSVLPVFVPEHEEIRSDLDQYQ